MSGRNSGQKVLETLETVTCWLFHPTKLNEKKLIKLLKEGGKQKKKLTTQS